MEEGLKDVAKSSNNYKEIPIEEDQTQKNIPIEEDQTQKNIPIEEDASLKKVSRFMITGGHVTIGDKGGDGGHAHNGGVAGPGGPGKGDLILNYGIDISKQKRTIEKKQEKQ